MKITILNGSPRKNGATGKILKAMRGRLIELGCEEVEYIEVTDCEIHACFGCERCYQGNGCPIKDDAKKINRHIAASQGIIIGSPTYVSNVSGILKTYIDRGHIVLEQAYRGKYMMPVVTYEVSGGRSVIKVLNNMFRYAGGIVTGAFLLKLDYNSEPFDNPKTFLSVEKAADTFYRAILNGKRKGPLDKLIHHIATRYVIGPSVLRSPKRYAAVTENYTP
jgi:multimeric flavodoxin WrbA